MRLHLVRHGESVNNAGVITVPDPPLTALGLQQADQLAASWRGEVFDGVVCSPLWRTLQTAKPLLAAVRVGRTIGWPALVEWNRSSPLDGHPPAEIAAAFPGVLCDPPLHEVGWPEYPGGETAADAVRRAAGVLQRLVAEFPADARLVVVAHQAFDGALLCAALGADLNLVRFGQGNTRVHTLEYDGSRFALHSVNADPSWVIARTDGDNARGPGLVRMRQREVGEFDLYLLAGERAAEAAATLAATPDLAPWPAGHWDAVVVAGMAHAGQRAALSLAHAAGSQLEVWSGAGLDESDRFRTAAVAQSLWDRMVSRWPEGGAVALVTPAPVAGGVLGAVIGDGVAERPAVLLNDGSLSHVRRQAGRWLVREANAGLGGVIGGHEGWADAKEEGVGGQRGVIA